MQKGGVKLIETKPLKKMMKEYLSVLEKYEDKIDSFEQDDIKRLIGEVRLFWYRKQSYVRYFLSNIDEDDYVSYLSGDVKLDIKNSGHKEYVIVKGNRLLNDPIIKMSAFYHSAEIEADFKITNRYLIDCFYDLLILLRDYSEDFFVLPLETIAINDSDEYYTTLANAAKRMLLSFFSKRYASIEEMENDNSSYEELESHLYSWIKRRLIFNSIEDSALSIEEKCKKALSIRKEYISSMKSMSESTLFFNLVTQHCMGAIATFNCMRNLRIMPYIRNDIAFQYFDLLFHSSINDKFDTIAYLQVLVPYILQKTFDFSEWDYETVKEKMGEGALIDYILNNIVIEDGIFPRFSDIVDKAKEYIEKVERN